MQITILCVGKLKEKYWREAEQEYLKRLTPYARVKVIEIADEPCPDNASSSVQEQVKVKEGERLLAALPPYSLRIALDLRGQTFSSEQMAARVDEWLLQGYSHLVFIIGGSLGLAEKVLSACQHKLSFGAFTYPHQLMRIILLEQIYRWQKIRRGEVYHK